MPTCGTFRVLGVGVGVEDGEDEQGVAGTVLTGPVVGGVGTIGLGSSITCSMGCTWDLGDDGEKGAVEAEGFAGAGATLGGVAGNKVGSGGSIGCSIGWIKVDVGESDDGKEVDGAGAVCRLARRADTDTGLSVGLGGRARLENGSLCTGCA